MKRCIASRKFYATLSHKLDAAEEEWLESQPTEKTVEFTEVADGETPLGGKIRLTLKSKNNNSK